MVSKKMNEARFWQVWASIELMVEDAQPDVFWLEGAPTSGFKRFLYFWGRAWGSVYTGIYHTLIDSILWPGGMTKPYKITFESGQLTVGSPPLPQTQSTKLCKLEKPKP